MLPNQNLSNAKNAARLSAFAEAAYFSHADKHDAERNLFEEEMRNGSCTWWNYGNAAGVVYSDAECIVIGVAGSDDRDDVRNGYDLLNQTLGDWSDATDIALVKNVANTSSTAGFLAYASLCYGGIESAITDLEEDNRTIWLAGHSLGGAAVQILQCTKRFEGARAYVYGAPRVFRGHVPEAIRIAVRRVTDPVIYGPVRYSHASCDTIWVRYPGSVRTAIPLKLQPYAYAYRAYVWTKGIIQVALSSLGVPVRPTLTDGHSMGRYRADLWNLR